MLNAAVVLSHSAAAISMACVRNDAEALVRGTPRKEMSTCVHDACELTRSAPLR